MSAAWPRRPPGGRGDHDGAWDRTLDALLPCVFEGSRRLPNRGVDR